MNATNDAEVVDIAFDNAGNSATNYVYQRGQRFSLSIGGEAGIRITGSASANFGPSSR